MGRASQRANPLVLAALLGAASALAREGELDWLHVPKTGTSFGLALVMYKCEFLEKKFEHPTLHKLHSVMDIKGKENKCLRNHGHSPLRRMKKMGHWGYAVESVVTMLRAPMPRTASGFVHNLHDCGPQTGVVPKNTSSIDPPKECDYLIAGKSGTERYQKALDLVHLYGRCAKGCMTRMITGEGCGGDVRKPDSAKARTSRIERAMEKLDRFAFVGITERWTESICVFSKLFPRESGRPLPEFVTGKYRPSKDHRCEDAAKRVLSDYKDPADEAIYAHGLELFERSLRAHPDCKEHRV